VKREPAPSQARLLIAATAVLFSTGGAVIKLISLNAWQVAGFRAGIAAVVLAILSRRSLNVWNWRYLPVGACYAATTILYVLANKLTTAANAVFLQDTAPVILLLLGPLFLKEPIRRADIIFIAAMGCGMALFFAAHEQVRATAIDPLRGNIFAAASAVTWALSVAGLRWLARDDSKASGDVAPANTAMMSVIVGNLFAFIAALPLAFPVHFQSRDVAALLWLGIFQVGIAYVLLTRGIRRVPAFEATTILLLEPALSPVWAWLVHGEAPSPLSITGGVIIFGATLINSLRR